jgi:hypothetical protein
MGNTSVKSHIHKHGDVTCTMKHGRRRAFRRNSHKKHYRRFRKGGTGTSPLNPTGTASTTSSRKKRRSKRNVEPSLHKLVLINETRKLYPRGPTKKARTSPPLVKRSSVKRHFQVVEAKIEPILEEIEEIEEPVQGIRRKSI